MERQVISIRDSEAISSKACREMEGVFCDYVEGQFRKPILKSEKFCL